MKPEIPGWMSPAELDVIAGRAQRSQACLEIGTYCGRSTRAILESTKGIVWSIDNLSKPTEPGQRSCREWIADLEAEFPNFRFLHADSAAVKWETPLDFLLIDGCHDEAAVLADCHKFIPHVRPGGSILLDDFNYPDVIRAWIRFMKAYPEAIDLRYCTTVGKLGIYQKALHSYVR